MRSNLSTFARKTANPEARDAANDMMNSLDSAMERSIANHNPADLGAWKTVRNQYRNMLVLEHAATAATESAARGVIAPNALSAATKLKHGRRNLARGKGDFADLAIAGTAAMKPLPDSGTASRLTAQFLPHLIGGAMGAGYGGSEDGGQGAVLGMLGGATLPYLAGRGLLSKPVQGYLKNQLLVARNGGPATQKAVLSLLGAGNQINDANR